MSSLVEEQLKDALVHELVNVARLEDLVQDLQHQVDHLTQDVAWFSRGIRQPYTMETKDD